MADPTRKKSVHIAMIKMEHKNACKKHPKFCDEFIDESRVSWAEGEMRIKAKNSQPPEYADCVLMEEVAEAFNAYSQGIARTELARVRAMRSRDSALHAVCKRRNQQQTNP